MVSIPASAVARGTGIETDFVDFGSGVARFVPQRIALIAQGETGISYSTTKFQATGGPKQVGSLLGYRSPAYSMMTHLLPKNGGGVGSIPIDVYPVAEASGATVATGDFTPSASAVSKATTFYAKVAGKACQRFTVPKATSVAATDISDWLESLRQSIENTLGVIVTVAHEYGTVTDTPGGSNTGDGAVTVAVASGGAPKAGTWTATCTAAALNAGTFTITDPDGFTVGTITAGAAASDLAGLNWDIGDGVADWIVGDTLTIEVPSSKLNVFSSWKGSAANDIELEIVGDASTGVTWAITQPTGGATNPSPAAALTSIGSVRTTLVINMFEISDTTALDAFQDWGGNPEDETGRWAPDVRKPAVVIGGNNKATVNDATATSVSRTDDNVNVSLNVPGSPNIPFDIAAAAVREIAKMADNNPPHDYGSLKLSDIEAGLDSEQWNFSQRDQAIKRGVATTEVKDGVVVLSDVTTMYAPVGEDPPAYRFVVDIVKLMNVLYNIDLEFSGEKWDGKPLIADGQPTNNPEAKTPSMAKTAAFGVIDGLGLAAIITNVDTAKKNMTVTINGPKRLDIVIPTQVSGNTNQKAISLKWGFFFG